MPYYRETLCISIPVDLTTKDPWAGIFIVPTAGLWRFTFMGLGYGEGYVSLRVDDQIVAITHFDGADVGWNSISINTLQQLQIGQNVTIYFDPKGDGSFLDGSPSKYTHWTGTYMQSGTAVPPECEYTGQGCNSIEISEMSPKLVPNHV